MFNNASNYVNIYNFGDATMLLPTKPEISKYLADNPSAQLIKENINGVDTKRISIMPDRGCAFLLLNNSPKPDALCLTRITKGGTEPLSMSAYRERNVISFLFAGSWDTWTNSTFLVEYVRDQQETNLVKSFQSKSNTLFLDDTTQRVFQ